ncbi:MAG: xanthine dehydrogenase family protein molybdopterin-binding subunit [Anaerolineales bacterium]|jgi:CO/xanthine dehydrogenase Mo-binding subunit
MKKRGKGFSTIGYCTGFYGGGDPNQAQINLKADGTFDLLMGTVDIGQGCKTAMTQIAAEELDVPIESITFINRDTDVAPFCMGSFASRVTFIAGNAVIKACKDLKEKIKIFAAPMLDAKPELLEIADNKVSVKGDPDKTLSMAEIGGPSVGANLTGLGVYAPAGPNEVDPETGAQPNLAAAAFGVCISEVEVDTETGVVEVLKSFHVYEIGKAISPLICKGQINGGAAMGIGMAFSENAHPYWPSVEHAADGLGDYVIATAADMPAEEKYAIVEVPHPDGPYGAKGFSEMSANAQIPAITAAIHDAVGVWISEFPLTPEVVLKALESKGSFD